jgi:DNA topoisomerase-2
MNLFAQQWPSLLRLDGFITSMLTPIVKAWAPPSSATPREFYSTQEFDTWKAQHSQQPFRSKYYKGLGTSTAEEARCWFRNMRLTAYSWKPDGSCAEAFSKAFNKKRADDRKTWLQAYDANHTLDYAQAGGGGAGVPYSDFIDRDLIHFSNYDVLRSIPSVMDGLKVSQRKALFGCRKRNLTTGELRVAQLAAYVAEHTCFHHGEASMQGTIVCMAQDFVGSGNNVPILVPIGQFGTRLAGGSDYASPRYIHTRIADIASKVFLRADDAVLTYLTDDGASIEPRYYLPVIPMILVNGAQGIGTGYSTTVPSYDPVLVLGAVRAWVGGAQAREAGVVGCGAQARFACVAFAPSPWHRGFSGAIECHGSGGKMRSRGVVEKVTLTKVRVSELPLGYWTEDFKNAVESLVSNNSIKAFTNESTDSRIDFTLTFPSAAEAAEWMAIAPDTQLTRLETELRMTSTKSLATTNMHMFSPDGRIKKYESPAEVVDDFCVVRLAGYVARRKHLIEALRAEVLLLANRARFVSLVNSGALTVGGKADVDLDAELEHAGLQRMASDGDVPPTPAARAWAAQPPTYAYLLGMRLSSLTERRKCQLEAQLEDRTAALVEMEGTTPCAMWLDDLAILEAALVHD